MKKVLLAVAGFDPTSGAGVTLDLRVFQKFGYHGVGILTSLTAQNSQSVKEVQCPSSRFLSDQFRHLRADVNFSGIKIGMIGCADNIDVVAKILSDDPMIPSVIDPVFRSSSGKWLYEKSAIPLYMEKIKGKASLLTPNLAEAEWISGRKVGNESEMQTAAEEIYEMTATPCLIKGGHLFGKSVDILFDGKTFSRFQNKKLKQSVHGTGCFLSSSILCHLVNGSPLDQAVSLAIRATHQAIKKAIKIGKGQLLFGDVP